MRVVRVFLSTPSDVELERGQVKDLVRDINETVQFLAPERDFRLEVLHYETHTFPDVGSPQDVIDRQIPVDYDLYLGIMWKRAGTPTGDALSGTIHEFEQALKHRGVHGWPVVMFFFCDEDIGFPQSDDDVDQLHRVLEFRRRLSSIGYTVSYSERSGFREALRPRLLRGLADILAADKRGEARGEVQEPSVTPGHAAKLRALTERYDETRRTMPSGPTRTIEMTKIFNAMVELASGARPLLSGLKSSASAGERLAAIAILHAFPQVEHLDWLAERLDNPEVEAPFVGYQAAVAISQAARSLPAEDQRSVVDALHRALVLAQKLPSDPDRIRALEQGLREISRRSERTTTD